jgi:hypothetical protein
MRTGIQYCVESIVDLVDHGKLTNHAIYLKDDDVDKVRECVSNKNRFDMFIEFKKGGMNYYSDKIGKFYVRSAFYKSTNIYSTSLMPGARKNVLCATDLFCVGIYTYHITGKERHMLEAVSHEYEKLDYYSIINMLELFSRLLFYNGSSMYYDHNAQYGIFTYALQYFNKLKKHHIWELGEPRLTSCMSHREQYNTARLFLDRKKNEYLDYLHNNKLTTIQKYKALENTIRVSTNNPRYTCGDESLSGMKIYILKYCGRNVILLLNSEDAVRAKFGLSDRLYLMLNSYVERDYSSMMEFIIRWSYYSIVKKYLHKIRRRMDLGYKPYSVDIINPIVRRIRVGGNDDQTIKIVRVMNELGLIQYSIGYWCGNVNILRKKIEMLKQFMIIHDINLE